jgi:PHD/YefM family antitoxin component YafN of YafNO toxin-antitoxin module
MKTQFVTNLRGRKIAAVIPIKEYEQLMEDLHDRQIIAQRRNDERVPFEEVKKQLIADGILPG